MRRAVGSRAGAVVIRKKEVAYPPDRLFAEHKRQEHEQTTKSCRHSPGNRDKKFTTEFRDLLEHAGTDVIRLPHRSPNLNAYVEKFVLSIKSECLERMIFFSEPSLRRAVTEFSHHYHGERNHQGLGNALLEAEECVGSPHGKVRCRKRLGGLLSYYHRDAA